MRLKLGQPVFRIKSVRQHVVLIIMLVSSISVLATTVTFSLFSIQNIKQTTVEDLSLTTKLLANRLGALLIFDDRKKAFEALNPLGYKQNFDLACIYTRDMQLFTHYIAPNIQSHQCPSVIRTGVSTANDIVTSSTPIYRDNTVIGYIHIESNMEHIDNFIRKQISYALLISFSVICISALLALRLQRSITRPVYQLAQTARRILLQQDYSIRAPTNEKTPQHDEFEILNKTFNNMLEQIQHRDSKLITNNKELQKAKLIAESASKAKSEFLSNMSHELRTPLNAIINFSEIQLKELLGPMQNPKYLEYAKDVHNSGTHLLQLINDILDLSKAEAGMMSFNDEVVSVPEVIEESVSILSQQISKSSLNVIKELDINAPLLLIDRLRLKQITINILSNAIKFTPADGTLTVRSYYYQSYTGQQRYIIQISDTGIGMNEHDLTKAMTRFGQVRNPLTSANEGTGLGLPLTKKLVEMQDGTLHVKSEENRGTTVTISFPSKRLASNHKLD